MGAGVDLGQRGVVDAGDLGELHLGNVMSAQIGGDVVEWLASYRVP